MDFNGPCRVEDERQAAEAALQDVAREVRQRKIITCIRGFGVKAGLAKVAAADGARHKVVLLAPGSGAGSSAGNSSDEVLHRVLVSVS